MTPIVQALDGLPVRFVPNPAWDEGMGGSIAAGVRLVGEDVDGVFIVPGDLPNLNGRSVSPPCTARSTR